MAPQDSSPKQTRAFKFVNISNPKQAKEKKRKEIVRRHVRLVTTKNVIFVNTNERTMAEANSTEIVENGLAFVNTTHPDQVKSVEMRTFVKQNAQRRIPTKIPHSTVTVQAQKDNSVIDSWSRDLSKTTSIRRRDNSDELSDRGRPSAVVISGNDVELDVPSTKVINVSEAEVQLEVMDSWSRHLPKRKRQRATRQSIISRKEMRAQQSKFRVAINEPGTAWEKAISIVNRENLPMSLQPVDLFPIKMNTELYGLVTYLHTDHNVTHVPPAFIASWFCIIIEDAAAFQTLLSLSAKSQSLVRGVKPREVGMRLYGNALTSVHERLGNPNTQRSIGLFTGVLMFLALDLLQLDPARFQINAAGVKRLVKLQGGLKFLDDYLAHRTFLLVAELCGAYTFDFPPNYYIQGDISQREVARAHFPMPKRLTNQLLSLQQRLSSYPILYTTLHDMYALSTHIKHDGSKAFCVNVALDPSIYIVSMKYFQILNDIDTSTASDEVKAMVAVVAYAGVLCMNVFRIAIADCPTLVHRNHILRMKAGIEVSMGMWNGLEDLYLWCLIQGGIMACGEDRVCFVEFVIEHMRKQGLREWRDVMDILEHVFYVELIFARDYTMFGQEVMALPDAEGDTIPLRGFVA